MSEIFSKWRCADDLQVGDLVIPYGFKGGPFSIEEISQPDDDYGLVTVRGSDDCLAETYTLRGSKSFRRVKSDRVSYDLDIA